MGLNMLSFKGLIKSEEEPSTNTICGGIVYTCGHVSSLKANNYSFYYGETTRLTFIPESCIQCEACINNCPNGVFDKILEDFWGIGGTADCDACCSCLFACPSDAIIEFKCP
jgi:ferredoxin